MAMIEILLCYIMQGKCHIGATSNRTKVTFP